MMYNTDIMFATLARWTSRFRIPIIISWIALAAILVIVAPSLSKVGVTDDTQFLPQDTESTQAAALLQDKFISQSSGPAGSALIVVYNAQGLSAQDMQNAQALHDWLRSPQAPSIITGLTSVFDNEALRSTLVSQDGTTLIMGVDLSEASSSVNSRQAVTQIRDYIQSQSFSSQFYVTGNAGVSQDILTSIQETIDKATLVTIVLVIFLLLIIYRSPVAMLVPLITIGVSYLVARGITGYIAASGVNISSLIDAYMVVTLFGIGTDYCLFMVSRFKEELVHNERQEAGKLALKRIGPVILASATTVMVALLCLGISRFGMNRTSGFMLAIGVAITLLAGLTLTPALISFFGRKLLWPAKLQQSERSSSSMWNRIGQQITRRPIFFAVPLIILLGVPYLALPSINYSAGMLEQMPQDMDSVQGFKILQAHFPPGQLNPLNLVIQSSQGSLLNSNNLPALDQVAASLAGTDGVAQVKYYATPASQIDGWSQQSRNIAGSLSLMTANQLNYFTTLGQSLTNLAVQYPGVQQSSNFQQAVANLKQISAAAAQINPSAPQNIPAILGQIQPLANAVGNNLAALASEFRLQTSTPFTQWLQSTYFSQDGSLTRMDIILNSDPYAQASIDAVSRIRESTGTAIQGTNLNGASYYLGGTSAEQADILSVNDTDFLRVLGLAIIGILLVTIILLRSLVAPLYMILTVLLNFGATLGISTWLFLDVLHQNTIIYMLPIFVFVILIAVGSDYNIFLVSRIREESHHRSMKDAICHSVANTGGVITSCGVILAGTFATLAFAPLQMVFQVGTAIAIGVVIDTFLVRALLIPALTTLAGRWSWWPSRLSRGERKEAANSKVKSY